MLHPTQHRFGNASLRQPAIKPTIQSPLFSALSKETKDRFDRVIKMSYNELMSGDFEEDRKNLQRIREYLRDYNDIVNRQLPALPAEIERRNAPDYQYDGEEELKNSYPFWNYPQLDKMEDRLNNTLTYTPQSICTLIISLHRVESITEALELVAKPAYLMPDFNEEQVAEIEAHLIQKRIEQFDHIL